MYKYEKTPRFKKIKKNIRNYLEMSFIILTFDYYYLTFKTWLTYGFKQNQGAIRFVQQADKAKWLKKNLETSARSTSCEDSPVHS